MVTSSVLLLLESLVGRGAIAAGRTWSPPPKAAGSCAEAFALATRRLGHLQVEITAEENGQLESAGLPRGRWDLDELARMAVLVGAAVAFDTASVATFVEDCYRRGDTREREAVLRALPLLPSSDWTVDIGVDACRSSVQPIFEAIACENPFPAQRFPELNFNQMVLKALFMDVRLARIVGLGARITADLRRMAAAYASERRAAGRSVPVDIHQLTEQEEPR